MTGPDDDLDDSTLPNDVFEDDVDLERAVGRRSMYDDDHRVLFSDCWIEPRGK